MFDAFGAPNCECEPNANVFVQKWFSDCIYTTWELAAFWIGMSSVMFWIVAQLPQFISNLKNQTAEALSPWFLFQWLAGDSCNLLGCLLTGDQLATETFTATYFIFADCIIISQYIYYNIRAKEKLLGEEAQGSSALARKQITDYRQPSTGSISQCQKRLAKIVIPDEEDSELSNDAQHKGLPYHHPVTFVAGRSGAAMIAHAMHPPLTPHTPRVEHSNKFSQTCTAPPVSSSGRYKVYDSGRNTSAEFRASTPLKGPISASQDPAEGRRGQVQRKSNLEERRSITLSKLPEIDVERLFPNANAMKRHLRRLVNQLGLEHGPPSASRLTIHHVTSSKSRAEKLLGAPFKATIKSSLHRRPVKAAACLASLVAVGTSTNYYQKPRASMSSRSLAVGSRRLLLERSRPGPGMSSALKIGRKLLLFCGEGTHPWWLKSFGNFLGWGSSGLYFGSRFSQIAMNYQRRSAAGLSLTMLGCAILANTCMGVSILMRVKSLKDLTGKAPWILGSIGTVSLDIFILLQAKYLDARKRSGGTVPTEQTPLLA